MEYLCASTTTFCYTSSRSGTVEKYFCQTPVLDLGLGVDFTFAWYNNKDNNNDKNNTQLNFFKGIIIALGGV